MWLRRGRRTAVRSVTAVAVMITGCVAIGNAVSNVAANRAPDLALRFSPNHAAALAAKAAAELRIGREEEAAQLAIASIRSSALSSAGFQVLGAVATGGADKDKRQRLFDYTSKLNRRQTPAQIWLLQQELLEGDVERALMRVDGVMRVSAAARPMLYPILASALTAAPLAGSMRQLFANDPAWLPGFLNYSIRNGVALSQLAHIVATLPEESRARNPSVMRALLRAMVKAGDYSGARDFLQDVAPSAAAGLVRDPSFEGNISYAPFDWNYTNNVKLSAFPAGGGGLHYEAVTGQGGGVARQLVTLAPGIYRLITSGRIQTPQEDGGAAWTIRCADGGSLHLLQLPVAEPTNEGVGASGTFTVPQSGCSAQWLELTLKAAFSPGGLKGMVDMVQILPAFTG